MRIGVVSDTHSQDIPRQVLEDFKTVDLIIHAGDFCTLDDFERLNVMKEVKAVFGNMDDMNVRTKLPEDLIFSAENCLIGVYHGEGSQRQVIDFVCQRFAGRKVDAIVFGHSHHAMNEVIDGVLYFNPGSPNDVVVAPYCSYGILNVENDKISGKIIKLEN